MKTLEQHLQETHAKKYGYLSDHTDNVEAYEITFGEMKEAVKEWLQQKRQLYNDEGCTHCSINRELIDELLAELEVKVGEKNQK